MSLSRRAAGAGALLALITGTAAAQQFTEVSGTKFPQPDPEDYSNQVSVADLDGDGDLDIIFANGGGFASAGPTEQAQLLINNGVGVFTDESLARINNCKGNFRGVDAGDVDQDGDLDLLFANDFNQRPQLWINNGSGVFAYIPARLPTEALSAARGQFGDIDNDGDLDIYIMDGGASRFGCGQNKIYVNDGTGFYTDETAARHPLGNLCEPMDAIFGDVDGDFDLDVRTGSTAVNQSRLYINNGAGVYSVLATPGDSDTYSYDFGDIEKDGDLDLLGINSGPGVVEILLENTGGGNYINSSAKLTSNANLDDNDSKFFDYDDDGDLDIIIARLGGPERIYSNNGAGTYANAPAGTIQNVTKSSLDVEVADLDGDGDLDIVSAVGESGNFRNRYWTNNGPATDTHPPTVVTEQVTAPEGAATEVVVRVNIADDMTSDGGAHLSDVTLLWGQGAPTIAVPMIHSGHQIYRGVIDLSTLKGCGGGDIVYQVSATDFAGNTALGDELSFANPGGGSGLPADLDNSGTVDSTDLNVVLAGFGCVGGGCSGDVDGDGDTDSTDLNALLATFGQSCG